MKRIWLVGLLCILSIGGAGAALAQKPEASGTPHAPSQPAKLKRVIHSLELSTSKKARFSGNVTLRIASGHEGPDLHYYWGGKCKGTKVSATRLDIMMKAMKQGYAVEIPAFPIKYQDRILMCMQSIRISKE